MSDEQIKRMKAVLEIYADDTNWAHGEWMGPGSHADLARYALGNELDSWADFQSTVMEYAIQQRIGGG